MKPTSGDQVQIQVGQSGFDSYVAVNGLRLSALTGVDITIRAAELTRITLYLLNPLTGEDDVVSGRFISEEDYRAWQTSTHHPQP